MKTSIAAALTLCGFVVMFVVFWLSPPICTGIDPPPFMIGGTKQAGC